MRCKSIFLTLFDVINVKIDLRSWLSLKLWGGIKDYLTVCFQKMPYSDNISSTDLFGIPTECATSEKPCLHLYDLPCYPTFATASAIVVLCLYIILAIALFIKVFMLHWQRKRFTLKKAIFGSMLIGCLCRVAR